MSFRVSEDDQDTFRRAAALYRELYPNHKVTDSDVLRAAIDSFLKTLEEGRRNAQDLHQQLADENAYLEYQGSIAEKSSDEGD